MSIRYNIGEQIECGSQGSVVSALDTQTNKTVAIKIFDISTEAGACGFSIEYCINKIMMGKSKRICKVLDSFQIPNQYGFLVMEKYKQDLFDLVFKEKNFDKKRIKKTFAKICKAVRDLHRRGVANLDIKPENVLVDEKGSPFLCDFGCSYMFKVDETEDIETHLSRKVRSTVFENLRGRGTRRYAAPEVFNELKFNPFSADIYSLGILLHAFATAYFPTTLENTNDINLSVAKQMMDKKSYALLASMVTADPASRPSIEAVLHHPYFGKRKVSLTKQRQKFFATV